MWQQKAAVNFLCLVILHVLSTYLPMSYFRNARSVHVVSTLHYVYTRKNAQVATELQTSCNKSVHKLLTRCIRTACSEFVGTSLEQAVDKLEQA